MARRRPWRPQWEGRTCRRLRLPSTSSGCDSSGARVGSVSSTGSRGPRVVSGFGRSTSDVSSSGWLGIFIPIEPQCPTDHGVRAGDLRSARTGLRLRPPEVATIPPPENEPDRRGGTIVPHYPLGSGPRAMFSPGWLALRDAEIEHANPGFILAPRPIETDNRIRYALESDPSETSQIACLLNGAGCCRSGLTGPQPCRGGVIDLFLLRKTAVIGENLPNKKSMVRSSVPACGRVGDTYRTGHARSGESCSSRK